MSLRGAGIEQQRAAARAHCAAACMSRVMRLADVGLFGLIKSADRGELGHQLVHSSSRFAPSPELDRRRR